MALGIFGVGLVGIIFTVYLYCLKIFILYGFCSLCMISSVILTLVFLISIINFFSIKGKLENSPHVRWLKLSNFVGWLVISILDDVKLSSFSTHNWAVRYLPAGTR